MHKFLREFITEWRSLELTGDSPVVAAVSGGADSCALLAALALLRQAGKIRNEVTAAHYNHGLRENESDGDELFVKRFADRLGVRFAAGRMEREDNSGNLEQALRNARYDFLHTTALETGSKVILTGHTVNDQAETLLLNLIRGSGIEGLSGMSVKRPLQRGSDIVLIRPLLRWAMRAKTEEFCISEGIGFRHDLMNDDVSLSRIRIRKEILPALMSLNPKIVETLARTAHSLNEHRVVSDWLIEQNKELAALSLSRSLPVGELKALPESVRRAVIRKWLCCRIGSLRTIGSVHLDSIELLATSKKSGKTIELPGDFRVVKDSGVLKLLGSKVEK